MIIFETLWERKCTPWILSWSVGKLVASVLGSAYLWVNGWAYKRNRDRMKTQVIGRDWVSSLYLQLSGEGRLQSGPCWASKNPDENTKSYELEKWEDRVQREHRSWKERKKVLIWRKPQQGSCKFHVKILPISLLTPDLPTCSSPCRLSQAQLRPKERNIF